MVKVNKKTTRNLILIMLWQYIIPNTNVPTKENEGGNVTNSDLEVAIRSHVRFNCALHSLTCQSVTKCNSMYRMELIHWIKKSKIFGSEQTMFRNNTCDQNYHTKSLSKLVMKQTNERNIIYYHNKIHSVVFFQHIQSHIIIKSHIIINSQ